MYTEQKPSHILLVEDTPAQGMRFKSYLEHIGCYVSWATTGHDGLQLAQAEEFDLIILDIELPDINGFEICRQLKANDAVSHIPVIMLTTRDKAVDVLTGLENGALDYIPKDPFTEAVLFETLKQMGILSINGSQADLTVV